MTLPKASAAPYGIRPGDDIDWIPAGGALRVHEAGSARKVVQLPTFPGGWTCSIGQRSASASGSGRREPERRVRASGGGGARTCTIVAALVDTNALAACRRLLATARRMLALSVSVFALLASWIALPDPGIAVQPRLVADVNAIPVVASSDPSSFVTIGAKTYFLATTPDAGRAVWVTDGSTAGTQLVVDVEPGPASPDLDRPVSLRGQLYFVAHSAIDEKQSDVTLWQTDGTAAGTKALVQTPGLGAVTRNPLVATDHRIYFPVISDGIALWTSDGTADGTQPVQSFADITSPAYIGDPGITPLGDSVLFAARRSAPFRHELWRSDGTSAGTTVVKSFDNGFIYGLSQIGRWVYFAAIEAEDAPVSLWRSDGTPSGTTRVASGFSTDDPLAHLTETGDEFFFTATDGVTLRSGVWRSDGSAAGTVQVAVLDFGSVSEITPVGSAVYFAGSTGNTRQIWKSDGTPAGTAVFLESHRSVDDPLAVRSDCPLACSSQLIDPLGQLANVAGRLLFTFPSDTAPIALWVTDGTMQGTRVIRDIDGAEFGPDRAPLFLSVNEPTTGSELWTSDGTVAGTQLFRNIAPDDEQTEASGATALTRAGNAVFFIATDGVEGQDARQLWKTDGTAAGTEKLLTSSGAIGGVRAAGDRVFFVYGSALWVSDGTRTGTVPLSMADPTMSGSITNSVTVGDVLFYVRTDRGHSRLCRSDGTIAGTRCLEIGRFECGPEKDLVAVGNTLFYVGRCNYQEDLWVVADGEHPQFVRAINPDDRLSGSKPHSLTALGDALMFFADDGVHGFELWRSDGTEGGTQLVADIKPGSGPSAPSEEPMVEVNGRLYFAADDGVHGAELWRTDGTTAGTELVADFVPGPQGSHPLPVRAAGRVFAFAGDETGSLMLWVYDDASGQSMPLKAVPGALPPGFPLETLAADAGDRLIFTACDDHGCEPWQSDGTSDGTHRLVDIALGLASSDPQSFTLLGSQVLVSADDGIRGRELWAIPLAASCEGDCDASGSVSIAELITAVRIALGDESLSACAALDGDGNGTVTINEVIAAVNRALSGCPVE